MTDDDLMTCGTCGHRFPDIYPAGRCPREIDHPEPDTRTAWTVIGYDDDSGSYAIGNIRGHHQVYGDDDPAGLGTWAEWVWTTDDSDGNAPGRKALAMREARRNGEDEEDDRG